MTGAFSVLLGPDYAGKSSVLASLARAEPRWGYVSIDEEFLGAEHNLLAGLRRQLFAEVLPRHLFDVVMTLLQTAVVYLRDQIPANSGRPVPVDSYYYKVLAKCRLIHGGDSPADVPCRKPAEPGRPVHLRARRRGRPHGMDTTVHNG